MLGGSYLKFRTHKPEESFPPWSNRIGCNTFHPCHPYPTYFLSFSFCLSYPQFHLRSHCSQSLSCCSQNQTCQRCCRVFHICSSFCVASASRQSSCSENEFKVTNKDKKQSWFGSFNANRPHHLLNHHLYTPFLWSSQHQIQTSWPISARSLDHLRQCLFYLQTCWS